MSFAPPSRAALLSLAEWQLSISPSTYPPDVPNEYLEELRKHTLLYPNDIHFLIKTEPGVGFGYVICLEADCNRAVIDLVARIDLPDGGLSRGYGSLASYRVHITNSPIAHDHSDRLNGSLLAPKIEPESPVLPSNPPALASANVNPFTPHGPQTTWPPSQLSTGVPIGAAFARKHSFEPEDECEKKKVRMDVSQALPSNGASSSLSSWSCKAEISNIDSRIIESRQLLDRYQRIPRQSIRHPHKEEEIRASIRELESTRSALHQATNLHQAAASMPLNMPLEYEPMDIQAEAEAPRIPMNALYVAQTEGINEFLLTAENATFFDGEATVEKSLASLGLKDLFTILPGMNVLLLSHQVLSLDWMVKQEQNVGMRGGCLADEMGLGKTVQLIALMVKNRSTNPSRKTNLIIAPLALLDQWQLEIEMKTNCGFSCYIHHGKKRLKQPDDVEKYDVVLTTYHTLAAEWSDPEAKRIGRYRMDIDDFVVEDGYSSKKKETSVLHQVNWYRIILDEAHLIKNRKAQTSRVVVDLGDMETYRWCLTGTPIVNQLADAYSLLRFLRIRPWYDWKDFNSQIASREKRSPNLATSRLQTIFRTMLLRRKKETMLGGRRLIELPPKHIHLVRLEFSAQERALYEMVETRSQATFNEFLGQGTVLKNYNHVFEMLLRLRQICSHPLLITDQREDMNSTEGRMSDSVSEYDRALRVLGSECVSKVVTNLRKSLKENMIAESQAADAAALDEECPVCFEIPTECVVTRCTHSFCRECIVNVLNTPPHEDAEGQLKYKGNERPCPVCRAPVSGEKLFARKALETEAMKLEGCESNADSETELYRDDVMISTDKDTSTDATTPSLEDQISAKMKHTMTWLKTWKQEHPNEKVVIISQWTRYLEIMSKYLTSEGFVHERYQGSMSRKERNRSVKAFMTSDDTTVMLMSLKCGGVGLNLTRANHVISLDLSWSSAVETQSFDRVHRLGQQRNVFVQRLVIANTIEDRILDLQERKKALSESSLGEGSGKRLGKLTVKELANLFGLDHRTGRVL